MEPHRTGGRSRHAAHQKNRSPGYLFGGLIGAVCLLALIFLCSKLGWTSAGAEEQKDPEGTTPSLSISVQGGDGSSSQETSPDQAAPWNLRLVNPDHPLPEGFSVEVTNVWDCQFDSRAADALSQMLDDMTAQGLSPLVCSSFRTWDDQNTLHREEVEGYLEKGYSQEEAEKEASRWVVPAGTSEHQSGLAADIVSSSHQLLDQEQENTPEQKWLMEHGWEYGFILRYPQDKASLTGVGYEPWHYRYVGKEAAQEITQQGLCLEEYWAAHYSRNGD